MATNIKKINKHWTGNGVPQRSDFPLTGLSGNDTYSNLDNGDMYTYASSTGRFTITTAPIYGKGLKGDKGEKGDAGVCPPCPPPTGGGSGDSAFLSVAPNGVDDTAAIQALIDQSFISGKTIVLFGNYKISKGLKVAKNHSFLNIQGWAKLEAINSNKWTFIYSDTPANTAEAEGVYTWRKIRIGNIILKGMNQAQAGIDLFGTEGASYEFIWGFDLSTNLTNCFGLRSNIYYVESNACLNGIKVISGAGRWGDATTSNSCSNGCTITAPRVYGAANTDIGIDVRDSSMTKIISPVLEGNKMNIGINWECVAPTSTGAYIERPHFEAANPCGTAAIRIKSSTMIHTIVSPNLIKPSLLIDIVSTGGNPMIDILNSSNDRVGFFGTPIFRTMKGVMWTFNKTDNPLAAAFYKNGVNYTYQNLFTGLPAGGTMQLVCGRESLNGDNSGLCIQNSPK